MTLGVRVCDVRCADPLYLVQQGTVGQGGPPQGGPVPPTTARNHVVDGGEGETLVVEVSVEHRCQYPFAVVVSRVARFG